MGLGRGFPAVRAPGFRDQHRRGFSRPLHHMRSITVSAFSIFRPNFQDLIPLILSVLGCLSSQGNQHRLIGGRVRLTLQNTIQVPTLSQSSCHSSPGLDHQVLAGAFPPVPCAWKDTYSFLQRCGVPKPWCHLCLLPALLFLSDTNLLIHSSNIPAPSLSFRSVPRAISPGISRTPFPCLGRVPTPRSIFFKNKLLQLGTALLTTSELILCAGGINPILFNPSLSCIFCSMWPIRILNNKPPWARWEEVLSLPRMPI